MCSLKSQAKLVAIISIILTIIAYLVGLGIYIYGFYDYETNGMEITEFVTGLCSLIFLGILALEVLSLVGAIKDNKCLLIPFIVVLCICILLSLGLGITSVIAAATTYHGYSEWFLPLAISYFLLLGVSMYAFIINIKLCKELSSEVKFATQDREALPPDNSRQDTNQIELFSSVLKDSYNFPGMVSVIDAKEIPSETLSPTEQNNRYFLRVSRVISVEYK